MTVTVRFVAWLCDAAGREDCQLHLPNGIDANAVKAVIVQQFQGLASLLDSCRLAINWEYQPWEVLVQNGDELCFIPPVSGG